LINGFNAWITWRKQYQNTNRAQLPIFELADGRIKVNPLMDCYKLQIGTYLSTRGLPKRSKVKEGYPLIDCMS